MFQMHRIFCATPWEMEAERGIFHEAMGAFNEASAMRRGVLFIPVTLTNVRDKRPTQYVIDENIRECGYYILLLRDDWGPVERNFEEDYHLALQCCADPSLPMREVALLRKLSSSERPLAEGMPEPRATFSSRFGFEQAVTNLLTGWLSALTDAGSPDERNAAA